MTKTGFSVGGKRINAFVIQRLLTNEVIRMCHQAVNETLIPDVCWRPTSWSQQGMASNGGLTVVTNTRIPTYRRISTGHSSSVGAVWPTSQLAGR